MGGKIHIPLSKDQNAIIDEEDFELVSKYKWHASLKRQRFVAANTPWKKTIIYMHRLIMNAPTGMVVDHINGDSLDNRKSNLRICTNGENSRNRTRLNSRNLSGVNGVHWSKNKKRWEVQIRDNGKTKTIGRFSCLGIAIKQRKNAEINYYGEFSPQRGGL